MVRDEGGGGALDLADLNRRVEAEEFRDLGRERHAAGDIEDAAAYYQMSVDLYPTAEAHTGLAVTLAARSRWEDAVAQCEQAIALDPALGNAHNDLGVYLAEMGRTEEALESFERAINAPRYDCRHYPWYHKGRLYEQAARFTEARDAYAQSLEIAPDWEPARIAYHRALGWLN
jgi:Tfp pilus assembly protein PilF